MTQILKMQDKPLRQVQTIQELLFNETARAQLSAVATKHMNAERLMRIVANAVRSTPGLQECDPLSFLGSLIQCASLGLEPNTVLGHAYLIPFKNTRKRITECELIIGYKGFIDLALRSGHVVSIHADVVYSDDDLWSYEYGSDMHLRHKPGARAGNPTYAYCFAKLRDGQAFIVLPWKRVLGIREQSSGWRYAVKAGKEKEHPWHVHLDRMAMKSAVRALANQGELPVSTELADALERDGGMGPISIDPQQALIIEADLQPEPEPEPEKAPKKTAAAKGKTASKAKPATPKLTDEEVSEIESLVEGLTEKLAESADHGEVESTLELFRNELQWLEDRAPDVAQKIADAADAVREKLAAKEK